MKAKIFEHLSAIIAFAMIGTFGMGIWAYLFINVGILGGWFAGVLVIGIFWFMNHYIGLIKNRGAWVDVGLGLGIVGMTRDTFLYGGDALMQSLPTLALVAIGSVAGGIVAAAIEKNVLKEVTDGTVENNQIID